MKTTITALCNQKGGVGKTTSCLNLGVGLAQEGKKVLLVDCDPQGSLMISTGYAQPDSLQDMLSTGLLAKMADTPYDVSRAILRHGEGVDILPANIELSGVEVTMVNAMSREKNLKQTLEPLKEKYDHKQSMATIPDSIVESAKIDGAGHMRICWQIVVPMIKSSLATMVILIFNGTWNDYFLPYIFISSWDKMTLPLGINALKGYMGSGNQSVILAAVSFAVTPILIIFLFGQRYIVEGLTASAVKG